MEERYRIDAENFASSLGHFDDFDFEFDSELLESTTNNTVITNGKTKSYFKQTV